MKLRDHPLMTYYGAHSWPPSWSRRRGSHENTRPIGEIGILKDVLPSTLAPQKICFLTIEHCGAEYIGTLLLSDPVFCREIWTILVQNCGKAMRDIGEIDMSHTLLSRENAVELRPGGYTWD
jgi:hypothetical protein